MVISDIFDLAQMGRRRKVDWRENLVCGVAAHGTATRGYLAAARWLIEATELSGIAGDITDGFYMSDDSFFKMNGEISAGVESGIEAPGRRCISMWYTV